MIMHEQAERAIALLINTLENPTEVVPPYVENLLSRFAFYKGMLSVCGIIAIIVSIYIIKQAKKYSDYCEEGPMFVLGIVGGLLFMGGIAAFLANLQGIFLPEFGMITLLRGGLR